MYYILQITLAYLYLVPTFLTDSYTEANGLIKIIVYSSISGIVFGIIHFLINYCYRKKLNLSPIRTFFTPVFIMFLFLFSYYINFESNHFPYNHVNYYGFYLFVCLTIIWSFVSYIVINMASGSILQKVKLHFEKAVLKRLPSKLLIFIIAIFIVCCSTEVGKNEILTFKYGKQFEDLASIKENVGTYESFKVVDYSDNEAHLYYITNYKPNPIGFVIRLEYYDNIWNYRSDYAVWSTMGSADETIWPYWWHWFTR